MQEGNRRAATVGCAHVCGLFDAALMAAGPDEVRGLVPNQFVAHGALETLRAAPIPGSTGLSSPLTTLAIPCLRVRVGSIAPPAERRGGYAAGAV